MKVAYSVNIADEWSRVKLAIAMTPRKSEHHSIPGLNFLLADMEVTERRWGHICWRYSVELRCRLIGNHGTGKRKRSICLAVFVSSHFNPLINNPQHPMVTLAVLVTRVSILPP